MAKTNMNPRDVAQRISEATGTAPGVVRQVLDEFATLLGDLDEQGDRLVLAPGTAFVCRVRTRPDGTQRRSIVLRERPAKEDGAAD